MASPGPNRLLLMTEKEVKEMPPYLSGMLQKRVF